MFRDYKVESIREKVYYPLTHAQKRIYYDNQFHPGTAGHNRAEGNRKDIIGMFVRRS